MANVLPGDRDLQIVSKFVPESPHDGYFLRHDDFTNSTRDRILGTLASLGGLEDAENDELNTRMQALYETYQSDINLARVLVAIDDYFYNTNWQYDGERTETHQELVLEDLIDFLGKGKSQGYAEIATSVGKTYIIAKIAESCHKAGLRVLVLAPSKVIASQNAGQGGEKGLEQFAPNIPKTVIARHYGSHKADRNSRVVISTYQSLNRFADEGNLGEFDVILADEAHRALGDVTSVNMRSFSPNAVKLGFTATPVYGANKKVEQIFTERFHRLKLREAIEANLVSPVQALIYETGNEIKITDPESKDFTESELRRLRYLRSRNDQAVQFTKNFVEDGRQGLIACVPGADLAHPKLIEEALSEIEVVDKLTGEVRRIIARAVGGTILESDEIIAAYRRGEVDVLTFVSLIGEGFDCDNASFGINLCPTTSPLKLEQFFGRIIRKKKDDLRPALFVDFIDQSFGKTQATALHVLGEDTYDVEKIYSSQEYRDSGPTYRNGYLEGLLYPELYSSLRRHDGKLLRDILVPADANRRQMLETYYERRLEKEGLGLNRGLFGVPQKLQDAITDFEDHMWQNSHRPPDQEEVYEFLRSKKLLTNKYGYSDFIGALLEREIIIGLDSEPIGEPSAVEDAGDLKLASQELEGYLAKLPSRDVAMLKMRFGFDDGETKTLDAVGAEIGVTRAAVAVREAKALSMLRDIIRAEKEMTDASQTSLLRRGPDGNFLNMTQAQEAEYIASLRNGIALYQSAAASAESISELLGSYGVYIPYYLNNSVSHYTDRLLPRQVTGIQAKKAALIWLRAELNQNQAFLEELRAVKNREGPWSNKAHRLFDDWLSNKARQYKESL